MFAELPFPFTADDDAVLASVEKAITDFNKQHASSGVRIYFRPTLHCWQAVDTNSGCISPVCMVADIFANTENVEPGSICYAGSHHKSTGN